MTNSAYEATDSSEVPVINLNYNPADPDKMLLPAGKTCGDCAHIHRCKAMFGHTETDTYCDWSPSRFIPVKTEGAAQ